VSRTAVAFALGAVGLLLVLVAQGTIAGAIWTYLGGVAKPVVPTPRLLALAGEHLGLTLMAIAPAALAGIGRGIVATRPAGAELRSPIDAMATAAQAVPPVVVVALAVPALGFGIGPTALALFAYCLMPILRATVSALEAAPRDARDAAEAMGFTPAQILWRIELPLAAGLIADAIRVALVLAIATAAVGALAGAATLGTPIVTGLQNQNELQILQGAAGTAALAFLSQGLFLAGLALFDADEP
jgi:osmoprotectant transport system permease protein